MENPLERKELFSKRTLTQLIVPLVVEQFLAVAIGMADTVMVSSVGEAAVSGISLVDAINILLIQILSALATGGAVIASQFLGRRDRENACAAAKQLLYACALLASVVTLVCLLLHSQILHLFFGDIDADVLENCEIYFRLSALSYPFLALYNAGAALFRSMGNSKVSMFASFLMNLVNISGNALLIFVFRWGVAGAAAASLASRALGAVILLLLLHSPRNSIFVKRLFQFRFQLGLVRSILKIGVPNGLENGMFQIGKLLVQGLISTLGTSVIAANAISNNLASLISIPGAAIGLGMITVIGQCVGARQPSQAVRYTRRLMQATYLATGALAAALFFFSRPLAELFQLSPDAVNLASQIIRIYSVVSLFIWPLAFTLPNALRAAGDAKFTMMVSMLSMWIFRIGLSYLLAGVFHMGVLGVWYAMFVDWAVRASVFTRRFLRGRWKEIQII